MIKNGLLAFLIIIALCWFFYSLQSEERKNIPIGTQGKKI